MLKSAVAHMCCLRILEEQELTLHERVIPRVQWSVRIYELLK